MCVGKKNLKKLKKIIEKKEEVGPDTCSSRGSFSLPAMHHHHPHRRLVQSVWTSDLQRPAAEAYPSTQTPVSPGSPLFLCAFKRKMKYPPSARVSRLWSSVSCLLPDHPSPETPRA